MYVNVGGTASPCCRFDENFVCLTVPNAQHSKICRYVHRRQNILSHNKLFFAPGTALYVHDIYIRTYMLDPQVENGVGVCLEDPFTYIYLNFECILFLMKIVFIL